MLILLASVAGAATWQDVENTLGRTGKIKGNTLQVQFPRSDLSVTVKGLKIGPDLGLTSLFAFQTEGRRNAIVTAEFVLLETEVPRVQAALKQGGLPVTAQHNHMMNETPRIIFMHSEGRGDRVKLARVLRDALTVTATPMGTKPPKIPASVNWSAVESILKEKGDKSGNVINFSVPMDHKVSMFGTKISPELDPAHDINFQMQNTGNAIGAGEFACIDSEVPKVTNALLNNMIAVTAVHNHYIGENPKLIYVHYYVTGNPDVIARSLRHVLDILHAR